MRPGRRRCGEFVMLRPATSSNSLNRQYFGPHTRSLCRPTRANSSLPRHPHCRVGLLSARVSIFASLASSFINPPTLSAPSLLGTHWEGHEASGDKRVQAPPLTVLRVPRMDWKTGRTTDSADRHQPRLLIANRGVPLR